MSVCVTVFPLPVLFVFFVYLLFFPSLYSMSDVHSFGRSEFVLVVRYEQFKEGQASGQTIVTTLLSQHAVKKHSQLSESLQKAFALK